MVNGDNGECQTMVNQQSFVNDKQWWMINNAKWQTDNRKSEVAGNDR